MIPDITDELKKASNEYIDKLNEEHSNEFVMCVLMATKMRAKIALLSYDKTTGKASEEDVAKAIQESSHEMALVTTMLGLEAKDIMAEADKFYDTIHAQADIAFKQKEH